MQKQLDKYKQNIVDKLAAQESLSNIYEYIRMLNSAGLISVDDSNVLISYAQHKYTEIVIKRT